MNLPLLSIVINNYNYGRFLSCAIDSALAQTYARVEVIVVDDGSTDDSRQVIAQYYDGQVTAVLQANGGQGAAFNRGFARSAGDYIVYLDADDWLAPDIAQHVVDTFTADPTLAKVQYRLATIDEAGTALGTFVPAQEQPMPHGNLLPRLLTAPDDICWQPTSGNAFPRAVLAQMLPMPTAPYRICADYFLSNIAPLFGPVHSLEAVGGYYRIHGANNHEHNTIHLSQTREIITRTVQTHVDMKRFTDALSLPFAADPAAVLSVTFLAQRLISLKLEPTAHPIPDDTQLALVARGVRAAYARRDAPLFQRCIYAAWFVIVLVAPRQLARWAAAQFFGAARRPAIGQLLVRRLG